MYSHLIISTGWTYEQVQDQFDVPRLNAMNRYWQSNPPLHILVARYMGIEPEKKATPDNTGLLEALQAFQQG